MNYLFEDDENDDDDHDGKESSIVKDNNHIILTRDIETQEIKHDKKSRDNVFGSDDELLNQWESEVEDVVDLVETSEEGGESASNNSNNRENRERAWKKMFEMATAEQEKLLGQMINL